MTTKRYRRPYPEEVAEYRINRTYSMRVSVDQALRTKAEEMGISYQEAIHLAILEWTKEGTNESLP